MFRVIVNRPLEPLTPDEACILYLGMDIETLAAKFRAGELDYLKEAPPEQTPA